MPFRNLLLRNSDRAAGALIMSALGDAIGFLVEGHPPAVCAQFARDVFLRDEAPAGRGDFPFGQYSDDTQLSRELALSLAACRGWNPDDYAGRIARMFARGVIVGRGRATEAAAHRLIAGVPWYQAGEPPPSAGNGASMRVAPVGLWFCFNEVERRRVADEQARITHADPRARAAAVLVADVVATVQYSDSVGEPDWYEDLAKGVEALDPGLAAGVRQMWRWRRMPSDEVLAEILSIASAPEGSEHRFEQWAGVSPFATHSALYALYAFSASGMYHSDGESVLAEAISVGGDVDTVAAMAGAMVGANIGLKGMAPRLLRWAAELGDRGAFGMTDLALLGRALVTEDPETRITLDAVLASPANARLYRPGASDEEAGELIASEDGQPI